MTPRAGPAADPTTGQDRQADPTGRTGCRLDHTQPYQHTGAPPGQTRPDNLGPLGSRVHRAKTHGHFHLDQPRPGVFEWHTPLGYRYRVSPDRTEYLGNDRVHIRERSPVETRLGDLLAALRAA